MQHSISERILKIDQLAFEFIHYKQHANIFSLQYSIDDKYIKEFKYFLHGNQFLNIAFDKIHLYFPPYISKIYKSSPYFIFQFANIWTTQFLSKQRSVVFTCFMSDIVFMCFPHCYFMFYEDCLRCLHS